MSKRLIAMAAAILFVGVSILGGGVGLGAPMPDPTASATSSATAAASPTATAPASTAEAGNTADPLLPPTSKDTTLKPSTADATVNIPDAKLKAKLKALAGVSASAAIKRSNLAMLTGGLDLSGLGIAKVEGLQYCENITAISLVDNKVSDLPSTFSKLKKITYLNLEDNNFSKIPDAVYSLTTLAHFSIKKNAATKVGDKIGQLVNLVTLDLSDNKLDSIAANISKLTKLTKLDLSGNKLRSVPRDIFVLPLLAEVNLSDNVLKELPDAAAAAPKLVSLNVEDNILDKLPSGLGGAPSLLKVYAAINRLTIIEPSLLNGKVTDLTLDVNRITELPTALTGKSFNTFSIEWNFIDMAEGSEARKIADTILGSTKAYLRQLKYLPAPEFKETTTTVYLQWPLLQDGQEGDSSWTVKKYQIYIDKNGVWGNPIAELDRLANRYVATGLKAETAYKFQLGVEYSLTLNGRKVTHRYFTPVEVKTLSASATAAPTVEPTAEPVETALETDLPTVTEPAATNSDKPASSGGGSKTALVILIIVGAVVVLGAGLFFAMSMARRGRRNY